MRFRLKALGIHLLGSAASLTLVLGGLYLGWYRWPGWYLADASHLVLVIIGVDLVLGPTLTFVIANRGKSRRELTRDIGMIVAVQLVALVYGSASLWNGRPLYYAFSVNCMSLVQAYDISDDEAKLARQSNPSFAPHWYSLPRWVWAPLPESPDKRAEIVQQAVSGGDDVISMPRYFKSWESGLPALRTQLRKPNDLGFFLPKEKAVLRQEMQAAGVDFDKVDAIPMTGRGRPLLVVVDAQSRITRMFKPK